MCDADCLRFVATAEAFEVLFSVKLERTWPPLEPFLLLPRRTVLLMLLLLLAGLRIDKILLLELPSAVRIL